MRSTMDEVRAAENASRSYRRPIANLSSYELYHLLAAPTPDQVALDLARDFLEKQLSAADALEADLPEKLGTLPEWIERRAEEVGIAYESYLQERRDGAPRRYFSGKAHALNFLIRVAPTKLVDGAWLFSTLEKWRDPLFRPLILTYLEELGDGDQAMNHVALFRDLLQANGCEHAGRLSDEHYVQGAIQLALAYHGRDFVPEVFGFNLGYEQLPLHLLITAYELNELGIDPYYFTLHVTIDNAGGGHARKAVEATLNAMSLAQDRDEFFRRMRRGYLLNELGASTVSVISSFDLEEELVRLLAEKSRFGKLMHSDYCRIGGKTVNQWLEEPASISAFLAELQKGKWIVRGVDAGESRFWRLIDAAGGEMFGVFSGYEKQVLREWIENDHPPRRLPTFRAARRSQNPSPSGKIDTPASLSGDAMDSLLTDLTPGRHHFDKGFLATRAFSHSYRRGYPERDIR